MATRPIDLGGLGDDDLKAVEALVERLRQKHARDVNGQPATTGRIVFHEKKGTVYGDLTRGGDLRRRAVSLALIDTLARPLAAHLPRLFHYPGSW